MKTTNTMDALEKTNTNYDTVVQRAFAAWFRFCKSVGGIPTQPANTSGIREYEGKEYVVLENINGILAVYRIKNDGFLRCLKRWPKALEN